LAILQDLIRVADLLELLLGGGVVVVLVCMHELARAQRKPAAARHTGMVLECARLVCLLQLLLRGIRRDLSRGVSSLTQSVSFGVGYAYAKHVVELCLLDHFVDLL
jgi:hypothetical protein